MSTNKTVSLALEALQFGDAGPQYFDASKQDLASKPHDIEKILPQSKEPQSRFLEILTSSGYELCVKKLAAYLKLPLDQLLQQHPNVYSFTALIMGALASVQATEQTHKKHLEQLAIKVVLDLPEFSLFKELIDNGIIKLDVQLGMGELQGAISEEELTNEQEQVIEEIEPQLEGDVGKKLKRAFHNFLTQGNALHKSYLFNMANEQLNAIDNTLTEKYGLIMAVTHILYYGTPYISGPALKGAAMGSEEVDGDAIKVRGMCFPVLVHELVKGLFDYLGQDISPESHAGETIEDEYMQLMAGPALFQKLFATIPNNKIELFPMIYRLLLKRGVDDIKNVIDHTPQGTRIIQGLVIDAERQRADQLKSEEEPNEWVQDFDLGLDDADEDEEMFPD